MRLTGSVRVGGAIASRIDAMQTVLRSLVVAALVLGDAAPAQETAEAPIHWAYSAYYGTGSYSLGDEATVYTLSARPGYTWQDAALEPDGARRVGIDLRVPVSLGAHDFDIANLGATLNADNVATLSVVPGVEIDVPVNDRWSVKPLVYAGWGTALDGDESAWIYWVGVKSRLRLGRGGLDWALVNALTRIAYSGNPGNRGSLAPLLTGFEFERPLGKVRIADAQARLHWHVAYTKYLDAFEFTSAENRALAVHNEWELGAAFSTGTQPLKLWRLRWDRVGVAYRMSSSGDFEGIGLVFHSLFDR